MKNSETEGSVYSKEYAEFITVTCLEWKPVLHEDRFKDIIMDSLSFLTKSKRVTVYAFVIMSNHFHMIWQMVGDHKREDVQRDFLKFTGQQILKILRTENSRMQDELLVHAKDRKRQVWERNSLGIPLWSDAVMWQKLDYIHNNPVKAGLCKNPEDYKYSSAGFYCKGDKCWDFLMHCDG
jgi:putative transposase